MKRKRKQGNEKFEYCMTGHKFTSYEIFFSVLFCKKDRNDFRGPVRNVLPPQRAAVALAQNLVARLFLAGRHGCSASKLAVSRQNFKFLGSSVCPNRW